MLFTWPDAMVIAAAEVKPAITGTDIKSISTPKRNNPKTKIMMPLRNARRTA